MFKAKASFSLPHLNIQCGKESVTCLVNTGSSISLISIDKFNEIKKSITYKNIANNVTISTVKFYRCIQFTFKVGKFFFNCFMQFNWMKTLLLKELLVMIL